MLQCCHLLCRTSVSVLLVLQGRQRGRSGLLSVGGPAREWFQSDTLLHGDLHREDGVQEGERDNTTDLVQETLLSGFRKWPGLLRRRILDILRPQVYSWVLHLCPHCHRPSTLLMASSLYHLQARLFLNLPPTYLCILVNLLNMIGNRQPIPIRYQAFPNPCKLHHFVFQRLSYIQRGWKIHKTLAFTLDSKFCLKFITQAWFWEYSLTSLHHSTRQPALVYRTSC